VYSLNEIQRRLLRSRLITRLGNSTYRKSTIVSAITSSRLLLKESPMRTSYLLVFALPVAMVLMFVASLAGSIAGTVA